MSDQSKRLSNMSRFKRNAGFNMAILPLMVALAGCNGLQSQQPASKPKNNAVFTPLREPKPISPLEQANRDQAPKTQVKSGPGVTIGSQVANAKEKEFSLKVGGEPITVNYHDMPLPAFINEVFGEQLGLSFNLDPQIEKQEDLVTLRIAEPTPPSELFHVAVRTLASYGVSVVQEGNIFRFVIDSSASGGETPLLVSGRALPDVPLSHRPVFMFVPLKAVAGGKVVNWVKDALKGRDIQIEEDASRNAVMIRGSQELVTQALSIIDVLDQPLMRGKFSASIEPAFVKVSDLSKNLESVLNAEGYDAKVKSTSGSIILIPLEGTNQLVVFAASQAVLDHVREWVNTLDRRQQMSIDQGIFTYEVRNADAGYIVNILSGVENNGGEQVAMSRVDAGSAISDTVTTTNSNSNSTGSSRSNRAANSPSATRINGGNFVVDPNRNTIIYKGSGQAWADLLPVIQSLDKAAPSVLIEVLIAEVTLNDTDRSGFEFIGHATSSNNGRIYPTSFGTLGGLGVGASKLADSASAAAGLTAEAHNSAGKTRAILNIFQQNKRAEIRSRPRLMVKSGQQATIDVGTQVATKGAIVTTGNTASQSINSAKTGVRLAVKPVVHASGHVDIDIDQSLSEASEAAFSDINSPDIYNRQIKTMVTLQDGGSILLGGLISDKSDKTDSGVPWVSKIPILGNLFKSKSRGSVRTELMVMIIPYVVDNPAEGQAITKTIQDAFQLE
jgi:general secretion pathway protein D